MTWIKTVLTGQSYCIRPGFLVLFTCFCLDLHSNWGSRQSLLLSPGRSESSRSFVKGTEQSVSMVRRKSELVGCSSRSRVGVFRPKVPVGCQQQFTDLKGKRGLAKGVFVEKQQANMPPPNFLLTVSQAEFPGDFLSMVQFVTVVWFGIYRSVNILIIESLGDSFAGSKNSAKQRAKRKEKAYFCVYKFGSSKEKHIIFTGLHFILKSSYSCRFVLTQ